MPQSSISIAWVVPVAVVAAVGAVVLADQTGLTGAAHNAIAPAAAVSAARNDATAAHRFAAGSRTRFGLSEVSLEPDGGVYRLPVRINDALTLKFTIDSGAADVQIPADVVLTLARAGTVTRDDFIGSAIYRMADGSTVPSPRFRIRKLRVGNVVLRDVTASVSGPNGQLLLGQSFLSRLSSWAVDNNRHVLRLGGAASQLAATTSRPGPASNPITGAPAGAPYEAAAQQCSPDTYAGQDTARQQINSYFLNWSTARAAAAIRPYYADRVNYFGREVLVGRIMQGADRFMQRWPQRAYVVREGSLSVSCVDADTFVVDGLLDFTAQDATASSRSAGVEQFRFVFRQGLIVAEGGKVLSRD